MRVLVTGSSTGIGRALTERLLSHQVEVWGLARSDQTIFMAQHEGNFFASRCDVGVWAEVHAVAEEIAAHWPVIDGLVVCAGIQGEIGPTRTADPVKWANTVRSNLDGTFHAIRAFLPLLSGASRRSKIVCFSGGGATKSRPNFSAYGAAKTAIVRLVETIAEEEMNSPLDINAVAPGAVNTRLTDEVIALGPDLAGRDEYRTALRLKESGTTPLNRALDLVEWLLSAESDGISGRLLSAPWDPWTTLNRHRADLGAGDVYMLRRILPDDRGLEWS